MLRHVTQAALKGYASGAATGASGLAPAELKMGPVVASSQLLRCSLDLDLLAAVPQVPRSRASWHDFAGAERFAAAVDCPAVTARCGFVKTNDSTEGESRAQARSKLCLEA